MTDKTIDLDGRREMDAQKATDLRRLLAEVEANVGEVRFQLVLAKAQGATA